jgi:hypothetical protein
MTLIKKSDVKNHLASRRHKRNHPHLVHASQPDATGFSGTEPNAVEVRRPSFAKDFTADHASAGAPSDVSSVAEHQALSDSGRA